MSRAAFVITPKDSKWEEVNVAREGELNLECNQRLTRKNEFQALDKFWDEQQHRGGNRRNPVNRYALRK